MRRIKFFFVIVFIYRSRDGLKSGKPALSYEINNVQLEVQPEKFKLEKFRKIRLTKGNINFTITKPIIKLRKIQEKINKPQVFKSSF